MSTPVTEVDFTFAELLVLLRMLGACGPAMEWLEEFGADASPAHVWEQCPRADWLLWFAAMVLVAPKLVVLATRACVRHALCMVPPGEARPARGIELVERWASGDQAVGLRELLAARDGANAACENAAEYAGVDAAGAAACVVGCAISAESGACKEELALDASNAARNAASALGLGGPGAQRPWVAGVEAVRELISTATVSEAARAMLAAADAGGEL